MDSRVLYLGTTAHESSLVGDLHQESLAVEQEVCRGSQVKIALFFIRAFWMISAFRLALEEWSPNPKSAWHYAESLWEIAIDGIVQLGDMCSPRQALDISKEDWDR